MEGSNSSNSSPGPSSSEGLRHRHPPPTVPTSADDPTSSNLAEAEPSTSIPNNAPTATSSSSSWSEQLASARKAMAERVRQQMEQDGWTTALDSDDARDRDREEDQVNSHHDLDHEHEATSDEEREEVVRMLNAGKGEGTPPGAFREEFHIPPPNDQDAQQQRQQQPPVVDAEEKVCRICFDGEDEELGRLFSPCLCRGTSRFVHVKCLDRWRAASAGATAFYKCDQCRYEYKLRRTRIAGLAQNRAALSLLTILAFILLIFFSGFLATWILDVVEARAAQLTGSPFEDIFVSDYIIVGEGVREAVDFFAPRVQKLHPALTAPTQNSRDKYYEEEGEESGGRFWSFRNAASKKEKEKGRRRMEDKKKNTLLARTVAHFIKGISLVGIGSFFQIFVTTAVIGPFGLRGSLFRAFRPANRGRRNGDNTPSISQLVIVMFVLVGVAKAIQQVYRGVRWVSQYSLKRVEGLVMDV